MEKTSITTISVREAQLPRFNANLVKATKYLSRAGFDLTIASETVKVVTVTGEDGIDRINNTYTFTFNLPNKPKADSDQTHVGTINIEDNIKTSFKNEGFDHIVINEETLRCDDCGADRKRNAYFVFENVKTSEVLMYGSRCTIKFFGVDYVRILNNFYTAMENMSDEEYSGGRTTWAGYSLTQLITSIKLSNLSTGQTYWKDFVSEETGEVITEGIKSLYYGNLYTLYGRMEDRESRARQAAAWRQVHELGINAEMISEALEEVRNTVGAIEAKTDNNNDFDQSVLNVFYNMHGDPIASWRKGYGLVAYIIFTAVVPRVEKVTTTEKAAKLTSSWFGAVKERLTHDDLTVVHTQLFDGHYGYSTLVLFVDEKTGNKFTWFASGDKMSEFTKGELYNMKFTIKAHETYKEEKVNKINRAVKL